MQVTLLTDLFDQNLMQKHKLILDIFYINLSNQIPISLMYQVSAKKVRNGGRSEEINLSMINILFGSAMVDR